MVQINSVYVNGGQTVITLFNNEGKMMYIVNDIPQNSNREEVLETVPSTEMQTEIDDHAVRVWGAEKLYVLKTFNPISKELAGFILHCWHEVRLNEKHLFNK